MKKAVIYTRVSSEEQVKGNSLSEQQLKCKYFIKSKDGDIAGVYVDGGRGGETKERPELQRMLEDAKKGVFDAVVVYKIDRLSRSLRDFLDIQDYLANLNVELISVSETYDTSTPQGRLFVNMLGSFAEFEREQIKERINMGQIASMKKGNWKGSPPYGYDVKNKKLAINKKEAEIVKRIFKIFTDNYGSVDRITIKQAQKIVNGWNVPTKRAYDKRFKKTIPNYWHTSSIYSIIKNPIYTGNTFIRKITKNTNPKIDVKKVIRPKSEWIPLSVPQVIADKTFEKCQIVLRKNSEFALRKGKPESETMLNKLVYCSDCGKKFHICNRISYNQEYKKAVYYCKGIKNPIRERRCYAKSFISTRLEKPLWEKLTEIISKPEVLTKYVNRQIESETREENQYKTDIQGLEQSFQETKLKKERLFNLYISGKNDIIYYKEKEQELTKEEDTLSDKINELKQSQLLLDGLKRKSLDFGVLYKKLKANLNLINISYKDKCRITKLLVERVETNGEGFVKVFGVIPKEVVLQPSQLVNNHSSRFGRLNGER